MYFRTKFSMCLLVFCLTAALVLSASPSSEVKARQGSGPPIRLVRAHFDPLLGLPDLPGKLTLQSYAGDGSGIYLLQFDGPIQPSWRREVQNLGAKLYGYVPTYAFLSWMDADTANNVAQHPHVRWLGMYQPAYRLNPRLDEASGEQMLHLSTLPSVDQAAFTAQLQALGATVYSASTNQYAGYFRLELDASKLPALTRLPLVTWVEPYYQPKLTNDVVRSDLVMDAEAVWQDLGLYGEGQILGILDTGLDLGVNDETMNDDFEGRIIEIYNMAVVDLPNDACSGHGTHVAGSALGNGVNSGSDPANHDYVNSYAGIAPEAQVYFQAAELTLPPLIPCDDARLIIPPLDMAFQQVYDAGGRMHTNSWVTAESAGDYNIFSQQIDQYTWQNPDFTVLFAAANYGVDNDPEDGVVDVGSIAPPGTAKNCITVGAIENYRPVFTWTYGVRWPDRYPVDPIASDNVGDNASGMGAFSGRGPCDDGRLKPDVVAPGTWVLSAFSQADNPFDGGEQTDGWGEPLNRWYKYMGGTSMATPLTAGAALLVREYYNDIAGIANPSGALIKATLINGAFDMTPGQYGGPPYQEVLGRPDLSQGWGRVDLAQSLMPDAPRTWWYDDYMMGMSTGESVTYTNKFVSPLVIVDDSESLRVSLVWADAPGETAAGGVLVNDLDLEVIDPNGVHYYGNGIQWDRINNVEGVDILTPALGPYTITVHAFNVPTMTQPFALLVSGAFEPVACDPLTDVTLAGPSSANLGQGVAFTATVSPPTVTLPINYEWNFGSAGEGQGLSGPNPVFTYTEAGAHQVVVTATNCGGYAVVTDTLQITVSGPCVPVTDIEASAASPVLLGQPIYFDSSLTPSYATLPLSYTWDFGGAGSGSGLSGPNPVFTYTQPGTYTVLAELINCGGDGYALDIVQAVVQQECVPLTEISPSANDPVMLGQPMHFESVITPPNATLPIAYVWTFGAAGSGSGLNGPNPVFTYTEVGVHTVAAGALNCNGNGHDTHVFQVEVLTPCYIITQVNLSITTPGAIYTDTLVEFSADIAPDNATKPYTYSLNYGDGPIITDTSSADPLLLSHTFVQTGNYTVEIAAWNCEMAVPTTDTMDVTVYEAGPCIELTQVAIDGPSTGEPGIYTFTSSYQPPGAYLPINYTWDNGDDASTSVRSLGVGTHTLMITATNCTDVSVSDAHQIVIDDTPTCIDVAEVTLSLETPGTIYTDTLVEFSADIAPHNAAKPYTYSLNYGDGTIITDTSSADPLLLSHTFAQTGTFSVRVAAWNCEMAVPTTDTMDVTVYETGACIELTQIAIDGPSTGEPGVYTFTTTYQPTGASLPISYTWDNGDDAYTSVRSLGVGTHTLMITATNCTDVSVNNTHQIVISATSICTQVNTVTLSLETPGTIYTDTLVEFSADIAPNSATKPYTYSVNYDDGTIITDTSNTDPLLLSHTFVQTGDYTVEIAAWNLEMAVPTTDAMDITVYETGACVELTEIVIDGPSTGEPGVYTFTTTYQPTGASLPISYTWENGGDAYTSVRSLGVGTHTLMVTATNCTDVSVSNAHQIVISDTPTCIDVAEVTLSLETSGAIYTNTLVAFSADIAPHNAAKPYTYSLNYGDGTIITDTSSADPLLLSHTFVQTGDYTVEIAVWNCEMTTPVVDTVGVTVTDASALIYPIYLPVVIKND